MSKLYKRYIVLAIALLVLASGVVHLQKVAADNNIPLFGWGWASPWRQGTFGTSTIGWISFNSANPGSGGGPHSVEIKSDGTLEGWAWSSNVGWIKFGGLSGFPSNGSSQGNAHVSGNSIVGWARACAGTIKSTDAYLTQNDYPLNVPTKIGDCSTMTSRPDGWDGWIELSGTNHTVAYDATAKTITGLAWGATNVGWVNLDLKATPTVVNNGAASCTVTTTAIPALPGHYSVNWSSVNTSYCSSQNLPDGLSGSVADVSPSATTIYSKTCTPTTGTTNAFCSATITVPPNGTSTPPVVDPDAPKIQIWLNNDKNEAQATVRQRVGSTVNVNWRPITNEVLDTCTGRIDGGILDNFDQTPKQNGNPYTVTNLTAGTHSFTMSCVVNSTQEIVVGKTKNKLTKLQIVIYDPTLEEK